MAKITEKQTEPAEIIEETEPTIDTNLELLKYTSEVKSRIKKDITSDFILAKLEPKDKEAIIEMTANAYAIKKILEKYKEQTKWKWNTKDKKWEKDTQNTTEDKIIQTKADEMFDIYMIRVTMTAITNRNVDRNYILELLTGKANENNDEEQILDMKTLKKKLTENEEQKK